MRKRFHLWGEVTGLADSVSLSSLSEAQCLTSGEVPSLSNGELRHLQGELLYEENGLCTQLKHLFLGGQCQKDCFAQSSIKEKFQLPRSACFWSGAFQLTKLGSLTPDPKLLSWKRKGDCLASSEKPLCGFHRKNPEASQTGFCLQCVVFYL